MAISPLIASAAFQLRTTTALTTKSIQGLTDQEWMRSPEAGGNHLLWIVGHMVKTRAAMLNMLGQTWDEPWFALVGRGSKAGDGAGMPSPAEVSRAFAESATRLTSALEEAKEDKLKAPGPEKIPSADGTLAGTIVFLAFHDAYHLGQVAYLHSWLGHGGITG